jgi:hypothetical protein
MALPSRSSEPQWELELAQTLAATVHELSHCLNMQVLPLRKHPPIGQETQDEWIESWRWLDEGMAVAAEASFAQREQQLHMAGDPKALPIANDWLRFALDWVDRPERSMDDPRHVYQAAFFVRYVDRLMGGPKFLNEVWKLSGSVWEGNVSKDCSALTMLAQAFRQLEPSRVFCSPSELDLFASGYCLDSYFLNDPASRVFEPQVYERFKERAVTRTWRMSNTAEWPDGKKELYPLPGLACRYFRFMPVEKTACLTVRVLSPPGKAAESIKSLKAEVVFARPDNGCCQRGPDGIALRQILTGNGELACEIPDFCAKACDHAVLVVTNCDYAGSKLNQMPPTGYLKSTEFSVMARLA